MKKNLNIIDFIAQIPWWVSVTLSASFFVFFKFIAPHFESQFSTVNEVQISLGQTFAPVIALALLSPVTFTLFKSNRKKKLRDLKKEIQAIQDLPWQDFKVLVAEAYSRTGYIILENSAFTADPSIDIVMRKGAKLYLLQCRYWQNRKLGIREIKNLLSLMHAKQASGVFLLTTGIFTNEARHFAAGRPINLVDGIELVELLSNVPPDPVSEFLN